MTQPAAAPHDEKSTININSFFQRGNAEFLSRFKSRRNVEEIMRVLNVSGTLHANSKCYCQYLKFAIVINQCPYEWCTVRLKPRAFVKVGQHMFVTSMRCYCCPLTKSLFVCVRFNELRGYRATKVYVTIISSLI